MKVGKSLVQVNPQELTKLSKNSLKLNKVINTNVYDGQGKILFKAGTRLESEEFKDRLENTGYVLTANYFRPLTSSKDFGPLIYPREIKDKVNPFAEFDDLCIQLEEIFTQLEEGRLSTSNLQRRFYRLAADIQELVIYDSDALLGAVHLSDRFSYQVHHPMQIAVLTEVILNKINANQATRLSTLAAALTCNLAMNPYQSMLDSQTTPLTEQQRRLINSHPEQSVFQLKELGIKDELWLELVEQHHEKLDGTGYPNQLLAENIRTEAQILALADVYSAMVTPKVYREMKSSQHLRELFIRRGSDFNDKLTRIFINELGIYPPGVYVWLANGELAVVIGRSDDIKAPQVASIRGSDGSIFSSPTKRSTNKPNYAITQMCDPKEKIKINASQLWGFNAIKVHTRIDLTAIDPFFRALS